MEYAHDLPALTDQEVKEFNAITNALVSEKNPVELAKAQAFNDYIDGKGLDDNPYTKHSAQWWGYHWQMHIENNKKLNSIYKEVKQLWNK